MVRILGSLVGTLMAAGMVCTASASSRDESLAILEGLYRQERGGVEVWVNHRGVAEVGVGETMAFHFRSQRDGYLTVLYLDGEGAVTVLFPAADPEAGRILRGEEKSLSATEAGASLEAQAPIGRETILAIATADPIRLRDLGLTATLGGFPVVEAERVGELAKRLAEEVASRGASEALAGRFDLQVVQRFASAELPYTTRDIIAWGTTRVRSIERKPIDLEIHFDFGSDQLTSRARRNLDQVGPALQDPAMGRQSFALAGHTDDVGEDWFNQTLSERRAEAARRYLVEQYGIAPERLASQGFGETQPVLASPSEDARAMNRRVELKVVR